ncbi:hypothetical protein DFH94DRAFT_72066 [Russula ochroleuca]|uniref:Transmembrane protein n=1 Tax=Russula ochroleuca TaxID=152965 RepID=A0A9P5MSY3_9AGAM|nr:hypothetical protein DFH94DRAFT_72066 [Russula ochroleuca]
MRLSPSALPSSTILSASSAVASSTVGTESTRQLAWQTATYLVVALVFVAVVASIIWLIWNDPRDSSTPRRGKMESIGTDSTFNFPSASTLIQRMCRYFFTMLWPAYRHIRQATATSLGAVPRPPPALPLYVPQEIREPQLTAPRPVMPRDTSSFRVQSNPYSGSEPSSWPDTSTYSLPVFPSLPGSAP